jgi:hypothetical protein
VAAGLQPVKSINDGFELRIEGLQAVGEREDFHDRPLVGEPAGHVEDFAHAHRAEHDLDPLGFGRRAHGVV